MTLVCVVLAGCGRDLARDWTNSSEIIGTRAHALIAAPENYQGAMLGDKELILTFDDGPGPMDVTGELSTWLKNRPTPIHATFFVNGACIAATALPNPECTPVADATSILAKLVSDGHLVANHATTHRDLASIPDGQRVPELSETDTLIAPHVSYGRFFFRAPLGSWNSDVHATISASAMKKYIGPIYWMAGGGPTDQTPAATQAADWECWNLGYTSEQCGNRYLNELRSVGKGIVLLHDPHGNTNNHNLKSGTGNTVDMVKYIVPILEGEGFTFKSLDEDPEIKAVLPSCHATCATCSGPSASECTSCDDGKYLAGNSCSTCSTCGAGSYVSSACSPTADTVCAPCANCAACAGPKLSDCGSCQTGFYLDQGVCHACDECPTGTQVSTTCSVTANTRCTPGTSNDGGGVTNNSASNPGAGSGCNASPTPRPDGETAALVTAVLAGLVHGRRRRGEDARSRR